MRTLQSEYGTYDAYKRLHHGLVIGGIEKGLHATNPIEGEECCGPDQSEVLWRVSEPWSSMRQRFVYQNKGHEDAKDCPNVVYDAITLK